MVYNEKSQSTAKCLQTNYSNVADGAYAEPDEQNTEWMGNHGIIDADAIDVVQKRCYGNKIYLCTNLKHLWMQKCQ